MFINSCAIGILCGLTLNIIIENSKENVGVTVAAFELIFLACGSIVGAVTALIAHDTKMLMLTLFGLSMIAFICQRSKNSIA